MSRMDVVKYIELVIGEKFNDANKREAKKVMESLISTLEEERSSK